MRLNGKDIYLSFLKGDKGDKGEQGLKGDKGDTALSVKVGTVTTSKAGTVAKVTNSGTNTDLVLDFNIPKGDKGERGEKGVKGDSGVASGVVLSNAAGTSDQNGYTQAAVNGLISNPNLLINGDLRVNQRGQTSYTGSNIYTADRWQITGNSTINVENKRFYTTTQYTRFRQFVEDYETYRGKTVTASVYVKEYTGSMGLLVSFGGTSDTLGYRQKQITTIGINSLTVSIPEDATQLRVELIKSDATGTETSVTFEYIKLEIGEVATPNSPKPYAEELINCQRYYQVYKRIGGSGTMANFGVPRSTTRLRFLINLITQMRTIPTSNIGISNSNNKGGVDSSDVSIINLNTGGITTLDNDSLTLTCEMTNLATLNYETTNLTLGHIYALTDINGKLKIEFDAEIYPA